MSTLLAFAIVVLVVVGGLALWQRRTHHQPTAGRASTAAGAAADTGLGGVRARAGILTDARERGMVVPDAGPAVQPNQLSSGIDGDRVFRGYVWYSSDDPDGEFGVASTDKWRTLTLEFIG